MTAESKYSWTAFSETGRRDNNEDSWGVTCGANGLTIFAVADGLGGHADGATASRAAIHAFLQAASESGVSPEEAIRQGLAAARAGVRKLAQHHHDKPPSSTIVALAMSEHDAAIGHVGDSRLVVFRRGEIVDQTLDHNVREMGRQLGWANARPATEDPDASKLTRSLDQPLEGSEDIKKIDLRGGDVILLCSDGVSQHLPETKAQIVDGHTDDAALIERLRDLVARAALPRQDNFTAIAVKIGSGAFRGAEVRTTDNRNAAKAAKDDGDQSVARRNRILDAFNANIFDARQGRASLRILGGTLVVVVLSAAVAVFAGQHIRADRIAARKTEEIRISLETELRKTRDLNARLTSLTASGEALMLEEADELDVIRTAAAHARFLKRYRYGPLSAHHRVQSAIGLEAILANLRAAHQSATSTKDPKLLSEFMETYGNGPFSNDPLVDQVQQELDEANRAQSNLRRPSVAIGQCADRKRTIRTRISSSFDNKAACEAGLLSVQEERANKERLSDQCDGFPEDFRITCSCKGETCVQIAAIECIPRESDCGTLSQARARKAVEKREEPQR